MNQEEQTPLEFPWSSIKEEGTRIIVFDCEQYSIKTSGPIFSAISEIVETGNFHEIIFDFTKTTYVSSAGLRHFSSLLQNCDEKGIHLAIANISEDVKLIFEMSGYGQALTFINENQTTHEREIK